MGLVPKLNQAAANTTAVTLLPTSVAQSDIVGAIVSTVSGTAFLGDSTVTATNGIPVTTTPLNLLFHGRSGLDVNKLYVVAASAVNVNVLYFIKV
jgi:hypothetical protein